MTAEKIDFDHKGIGAVLAQKALRVPLNQREYAWEQEHVRALFEDIANAIADDTPSYFLGTIVLTHGEEGGLEVTDGQQRLATTAILLAAIRDYFWDGNPRKAQAVEQEFLLKIELQTEQTVPRLRLNVDDDDFFTKTIIEGPAADSRSTEQAAQRQSHERLRDAAVFAAGYVKQILSPFKESDRPSRLIKWIDFLRDGAQVIVLTVQDDSDAFLMFETLNDRGLRASQADLLKNHLLRRAGRKIVEAQQKWAQMLGSLEALGIEDIVVTYLRHVVICRTGVTRERELFVKIRSTVDTQTKAMDFLAAVATGANTYSAIFNPEHPFWNPHGSAARGHVRTLLGLRVEQIRPLMLAVMQTFEPQELTAALRLFVSWSVRFLVAGGGRGGALDRAYGEHAAQVFSGAIKTAKALAKSMSSAVPPDAEFEASFREARVSTAYLARYYLRALELKKKGEVDPETVPNADEAINLEHVMPEVRGLGWEHIDPAVADASWRRLGNMVLLKARTNAAAGNSAFGDKRPIYSGSAYLLTREVGELLTWGPSEIAARQAKMAKLAVETWPIRA